MEGEKVINIYWHKGEYGHGKLGYPLIQAAAFQYQSTLGCPSLGHVKSFGNSDRFETIEIADKGKPFFPNSSLKFSVSHSEEYWICAMDTNEVGADIQKIRGCAYEKIARRHFTLEEQAYISDFGMEGFFEIWAMREALGKYTGVGFFDNMPSFVNQANCKVDNILIGRELITVRTFKLEDGYIGAVCYTTSGEPEFVRLEK